jgi:hypothetical protein
LPQTERASVQAGVEETQNDAVEASAKTTGAMEQPYPVSIPSGEKQVIEELVPETVIVVPASKETVPFAAADEHAEQSPADGGSAPQIPEKDDESKLPIVPSIVPETKEQEVKTDGAFVLQKAVEPAAATVGISGAPLEKPVPLPVRQSEPALPQEEEIVPEASSQPGAVENQLLQQPLFVVPVSVMTIPVPNIAEITAGDTPGVEKPVLEAATVPAGRVGTAGSKGEVKSAGSRQLQILKHLQLLVACLEQANNGELIQLRRDWAPYYARNPAGRLVVSAQFLAALTGLTGFPAEAEALRQRAHLLGAVPLRQRKMVLPQSKEAGAQAAPQADVNRSKDHVENAHLVETKTASPEPALNSPRQRATALPEITATFLGQVVDIQERLLRREPPSPKEMALLQPVDGCAAFFAVDEELFLKIFRFSGDRQFGAKCREVVELQQLLVSPYSKYEELELAHAAALRRTKGEAARPGDERYFSDTFVTFARSEPEAAADFLELLTLVKDKGEPVLEPTGKSRSFEPPV